MEFIICALSICVFSYLTLSYSAYREVREKKLNVKFSVKNVTFFMILPIAISILHLKMARNFYKTGNKKHAKLMFALATHRLSAGTAIFLEFIIHSAIVDYVYGTNNKNIKIVRESKNVASGIFNKEKIKETLSNPIGYHDSVFGLA